DDRHRGAALRHGVAAVVVAPGGRATAGPLAGMANGARLRRRGSRTPLAPAGGRRRRSRAALREGGSPRRRPRAPGEQARHPYPALGTPPLGWRERAPYYAYRAGAAVARTLPEPLAAQAARAGGVVLGYAMRGRREMIGRHLERVHGRTLSPDER